MENITTFESPETFEEFFVNRHLLEGISAYGMKKPLEFQQKFLPPFQDGKTYSATLNQEQESQHLI